MQSRKKPVSGVVVRHIECNGLVLRGVIELRPKMFLEAVEGKVVLSTVVLGGKVSGTTSTSIGHTSFT